MVDHWSHNGQQEVTDRPLADHWQIIVAPLVIAESGPGQMLKKPLTKEGQVESSRKSHIRLESSTWI